MAENEAYPEHPVYDRNTIEFVTVAAEYCAFLENCRQYSKKSFLDKSAKLLSLLYLKTSLLPNFEDTSFSDLRTFVTEAEYETVRGRLSRLLGNLDEYIGLGQDETQNFEERVLSYISEDLTDVYQDLKDMIANFQSADVNIMNDALNDCKDNFHAFWGLKTLNALRAIHIALNGDEPLDDDEMDEYPDFSGNKNEGNTNIEIDFFND